MFDTNNPDILWVCPDQSEGVGTFENPFHSISEALDKAKPGNTIVLKQGIYRDNQTIELSGKPDRPIRIAADTDAKVVIEEACWFFYDTSDLIISRLIFKNAPFGAVSVIGNCKRNRFEFLQFLNCGTENKPSCTMYFGGSGGEFNVVEHCHFERTLPSNQKDQNTENASVALMISEGDNDDSLPIRDHILRRNQFLNYGFAVLIGSQDTTTNPYGHVIEYNTIKNCSTGGIAVKCGDTQVRANLFENCGGTSISIQAGVGSIVEDNRIRNSSRGISIHGSGHSISNNCIIQCKEEAITVCGKTTGDKTAAINLLIENNTIIDCDVSSTSSFIRIEPGTTSIIQKNLFYGEGLPYQISEHIRNQRLDEMDQKTGKTESVIHDNIGFGNCQLLKGVTSKKVIFDQKEPDTYDNDSGYGAQGWVLRPEGFDINADDTNDQIDYIEASILEDDDGNLIIPGENFDDDIFSRYYSGVVNLDKINLEEYDD